MTLTLEEQERRAYIAGDTRTAGMLAEILDTQAQVTPCGNEHDYDDGYYDGYEEGRADGIAESR